MQYSQSLTNKSQPSFLPWLVCFAAACFFFYEFIQMNMLNSIGDYLVAEYRISATELGQLSSWYFYANLIFLLSAGFLLDRVSTRKVILIALGICIIGTLFFSLSSSLFLSTVCRFFTGIGSAYCFLSCVRLASRWFQPHRMALVTGLVITMAMLGGMVAQTPLTLLVHWLGWRNALLVDVALGVVIFILIYFVVQDYPAEHHVHHDSEQQALKALGFRKTQTMVFLNFRNWLTGLYACLLNQPISLLGALWGNSYLQKVCQLTATQASIITSMIFFGTVCGSPLVGWLSDRIGLRRLPMIIGAILSMAIILMIMYLPDLHFTALLILFLALGLVSSTQVLAYPTVAESNPKILTATSVSVVSISAIGGYPIFQQLFGRIMDASWSGHMVNGIRVYTAADYHSAIIIMPILFAIGLIAALGTKETYCKGPQ